MSEIRILGIVGSLRKGSYNRLAMNAVLKQLPAAVALDLIGLEGIPVFNQDDELKLPSSVVELKQKIHRADAVLFATPEYNYSVPGPLKNAIDWASRPKGQSAWIGVPAAVMGVSEGHFGTSRAQYHLRQILVALNMPTVNFPEVMIGDAAKAFDAQGNLIDTQARTLLQALLEALVLLAKAQRRVKADAQTP